MIYALIAIAVVGAAFAVWRLRARRDQPEIRRDRPTFTATVPAVGRIGTHLGGLFRVSMGDHFWGSLEDGLIGADVGVAMASALVERVRAAEPSTTDEARTMLRSALIGVFGDRDRTLSTDGEPAVIVVVGVNGSGKTTTIAKLAGEFARQHQSVLVAAADTFRAAAAEQMVAWGARVGFEVVRGSDGADPAAVAFDGLTAARSRGRDVLMVDTAGRLHSKRNLMDELAKVVRVLRREAGAISETLLVLDGSTGQNGIAQASAFAAAIGVTGVAVTKLDGTAKGGVAVAVEADLGVPLKLIGVGEGPEDLLHFDPVGFVDDLLGDV